MNRIPIIECVGDRPQPLILWLKLLAYDIRLSLIKGNWRRNRRHSQLIMSLPLKINPPQNYLWN